MAETSVIDYIGTLFSQVFTKLIIAVIILLIGVFIPISEAAKINIPNGITNINTFRLESTMQMKRARNSTN